MNDSLYRHLKNNTSSFTAGDVEYNTIRIEDMITGIKRQIIFMKKREPINIKNNTPEYNDMLKIKLNNSISELKELFRVWKKCICRKVRSEALEILNELG